MNTISQQLLNGRCRKTKNAAARAAAEDEKAVDTAVKHQTGIRELMSIWKETAQPEAMPRKEQDAYMTVAFQGTMAAATEAASAVIDAAAMLPDAEPTCENRRTAQTEAFWRAAETAYETAIQILTNCIRAHAAQNRGPLDTGIHLKEALESAVMITGALKDAALGARDQAENQATGA